MGRIDEIAEAVMTGENPLISFGDTYAVREALTRNGYLQILHIRHFGKDKSRTEVSKYFRYRVNHGGGYYTQNTYFVGQVAPVIEDI